MAEVKIRIEAPPARADKAMLAVLRTYRAARRHPVILSPMRRAGIVDLLSEAQRRAMALHLSPPAICGGTR